MDIPEDLPDISIPPLIFPTFVENAFKHGVSYKHDSFITIMLDVEDGMLIFGCINSKPQENRKQELPRQVRKRGVQDPRDHGERRHPSYWGALQREPQQLSAA